MTNTRTKLHRYEKTGRGSKDYFVGEVLNTRTNEKHYAIFFDTGMRLEEITPAYDSIDEAQYALDIMADDNGWKWCGVNVSYPRYKVDRKRLYKEKK